MFSLYLSKKAITNTVLVSLIIAIITFTVLSYAGYTIIQSNMYPSSVLECKQFFGNSRTTPNQIDDKFMELAALACPAKHVTVNSDTQIPLAAQLVKDCWYKSAQGRNIFGPGLDEGSICLYCGRINSENGIENFPEKFSKEILKEEYSLVFDESSDSFNLNPRLDYLLPLDQDLFSDNEIIVMYYSKVIPSSGRTASQFFSDTIGTSLLNRIPVLGRGVIEDNLYIRDSVSSIYMESVDVNSARNLSDSFPECNVIFPNTIY